MRIRRERPEDAAPIRAVNESAFETSAEASLVEELREQARPLISLVAEVEEEVVGHIMFSPVTLSAHPDAEIMGLAPMAVRPEHQRTGVGSALVRPGLEECATLGCGAVVVLGHSEYYPLFGFTPSVDFGIGCQYEVPEEVFMALELRSGYLTRASGRIQYHPAFDAV